MGDGYIGPHEYHDLYGTWRFPSDKQVPREVWPPPKGWQKVPELKPREYALMGLICLPVFAVGAVLRLVKRDLLGGS